MFTNIPNDDNNFLSIFFEGLPEIKNVIEELGKEASEKIEDKIIKSSFNIIEDNEKIKIEILFPEFYSNIEIKSIEENLIKLKYSLSDNFIKMIKNLTGRTFEKNKNTIEIKSIKELDISKIDYCEKEIVIYHKKESKLNIKIK